MWEGEYVTTSDHTNKHWSTVWLLSSIPPINGGSNMATKVTLDNVIILPNNTAICPISTNKHSKEKHFTIDADKLHLVLGRSWSVLNDSGHKGATHLVLRAKISGKAQLLHRILFENELQGTELTVDHLLHWTDNRRVSVDLVSMEENASRGKAVYNPSRRRK
jgi:hypothetical protein